MTARIERILKLRDQAMKGVDMGARTMFNFFKFAHVDEDSTNATPDSTGKVEQKADHLVRICDHPIFVALKVTSAS